VLVDQPLDLLALDPEFRQRPHRQVAVLGHEQAQQQVLGADVGVLVLDGDRLGVDHRGAGPVGEALELTAFRDPAQQPVVGRGVALLGRLAGHAQRLADLRPGASLVPGLLDEVVEQLVAEPFDLLLQQGRRRDPVERGVGPVLHDADELIQAEVCHAVNLTLTPASVNPQLTDVSAAPDVRR
jgi:hypothetical protein